MLCSAARSRSGKAVDMQDCLDVRVCRHAVAGGHQKVCLCGSVLRMCAAATGARQWGPWLACQELLLLGRIASPMLWCCWLWCCNGHSCSTR